MGGAIRLDLTSRSSSHRPFLEGLLISLLRQELGLLFGAVTTAVFLLFGEAWFANLSNSVLVGFYFIWIFTAMLWGAFGVVRHADCLAILLGEPYGTLILTLAVISIEVALIGAIMITGESNPTLARDTMMAVIMIVLNGMVGLSLILGGWRHGEQNFNMAGARAFLAVLVPLAGMSLILPRFTLSTEDGSLTTAQAIMFGAMTVFLYVIFLAIQTRRHSTFFMQPRAGQMGVQKADLSSDDFSAHDDHGNLVARSVPFHAVLLVLTMLPIVLLSKKLAVLIDHGAVQFGAPAALGGVLVAILVLTPEGIAAFKAAMDNRLQRSVNICLGSALATIGLTVPAALTIGLVAGLHVELGLDHADMVLLVLTLLTSMLTFSGLRTNVLQGAVHMVIFLVYLVLIFNP